MTAWQALKGELEAWRREGRTIQLWWRDDDAEQPSGALDRLNGLSQRCAIPLHLATIPQGAVAALADLLEANPRLWILQHGYSHQNHAPETERKCELGAHRPVAVVAGELAKGQSRLQQLFGQRYLPILVPPWNRLAPAVAAALPGLGYQALSVLGPRPQLSSGPEINVHVDIINWRDGRRFAGDEPVLAQLVAHLRAKRLGEADDREPTGLMTHHLAHDEACWTFCERLFETLAGHDVVCWSDGPELLAQI